MPLIDQVRILPRRLIADQRGWFLKVIEGSEQDIPPHTGEVYLTLAVPGQARGNHFHPLTDEWFTIVSGTALLMVADPQTGERAEFELCESNPRTVYVPAGLAHVFVNAASAEKDLLLVAYAGNAFDPDDTITYPVWP